MLSTLESHRPREHEDPSGATAARARQPVSRTQPYGVPPSLTPPPLPVAEENTDVRARRVPNDASQAGDGSPDRWIDHLVLVRLPELASYLTVRLGEPVRAEQIAEEVCSRIDLAVLLARCQVKPHATSVLGLEERQQLDGLLRVELYRTARRLLERRGDLGGPGRHEVVSRLSWSSEQHDDPRVRERCTALRTRLGALDAELLELRYLRDFKTSDLATIVDIDPGSVLERLNRAERRAVRLTAPGRLSARRWFSRLADISMRAERAELPRLVRLAFNPATVPATGEAPAGSSFSLCMDGAPAEQTERLSPGTVVGGRYRIVELIGEGTFAHVYRALDLRIQGHTVALKISHNAAASSHERSEAMRELQLSAAVVHPSLISFKEYGWYRERLWFAMPFYSGETLGQRMRRGPLSIAEAKAIFGPLASALAALHRVGIRHQDIKPDNILLARIDGLANSIGKSSVFPLLLDFGVAAKGADHVLGGTPSYLAPEVAAHFLDPELEPEVSPKSDVFSLALVLRNSLEPSTRQEVEPGAVRPFLRQRAVTAPPLPKARSLRFLRDSLSRWLALDPRERPDAETFARELSALEHPQRYRGSRRQKARWLVPAAAIGAVLVAATAAVQQRRLMASEAALRRQQQRSAALAAGLTRSRHWAESMHALAKTRRIEAEELRAAHAALGRQFANLGNNQNALQAELSARNEALELAQRTGTDAELKLNKQSRALSKLETKTQELRRQLASERDARRQAEQSRLSAQRRVERLEQELNRARRRGAQRPEPATTIDSAPLPRAPAPAIPEDDEVIEELPSL